MTRTVLSMAFRVGRTTALAIGVAVMVGLVLGLASVALGADGGPFKLGKANLAQTVTSLIKSGPGPALDLQVDSGPPLSVNSSAKVNNLNSDQLDGKDSSAFLGATQKAQDTERLDGRDSTLFMPSQTYSRHIVSEGEDMSSDGVTRKIEVSCDLNSDPGTQDTVISGGFGLVDPGTHLLASRRLDFNSWTVVWQNDSTPDQISVELLCIDRR